MKKMYYVIDNNGAAITLDISGIMVMLEAEATHHNEDSNNQDKPSWTITLAWLTEEEFENLPEVF
jgi:hypothetical protein